MKQSRFINLTSYCVVEYMFEPLNSLNYSTDDFVLVKNEHTNSNQIFNNDSSYNSTRNIRDLSVTPIAGGKYAYLDSEKIPNYIDYDDKISETPITGFAVVLDQVRFHFISGFELDQFEALILGVRNTENDNQTNMFASILFAPETIAQLITFNSKPLFLGNATYDRYVDIMVPSIKNINEDFKTALVQSATFAAAITPTDTSYSGFIYNCPITITLDECGKRSKIYTDINATYDQFEVTEHYEAPLSQSNEFDAVGAYINESTSGDFIEFYLTFNSGFPEELISILNRRNPADDWIIIHQINIFEQVGSAFLNTSRQVFFQEENYDEPNLFRPVLKNAHEAVSMSVDYLARLTNKRTGEQIIREASYTLISPKKYGKKLTTIPLIDVPQSQKIYNKIIKKDFEATRLFIEPKMTEELFSLNPSEDPNAPVNIRVVNKTEYIPIFFTSNNISIVNKSSMIKSSDSKEEIVFGPGKLRFIISPFDNVIKLKVYTTAKSSLVPLDLNLSNAKYRLVFETDSGKSPIDNVKSAAIENLSSGEVVFNIAKKDSDSILQSSKQVCYLTSVAQDGTETLIYSGEWRRASEQSEVDAAIESARQEAILREQTNSKLSDIEAKIDALAETTNISASNMLPNINSISDSASAPVVNKFGVANPTSIKPTSSNAGAGQ